MKNTNSEKITLLRPLLIFLVVTTHIQGSLYSSNLNTINLTFENFLHALLSSTIAISALPLLSIISGYLAARTYNRYTYFETINKKFHRLLIPMLFWNLILALYIYHSQAHGLPRRPDLILYPFNFKEWSMGLIGLFRLPANQPLYFLKELFICFLLLPVLNKISKTKTLTLIFLLLISYMSVNLINLSGLIHRVDIYGFFVIGLFIFNNKISQPLKDQSKEKAFECVYILLYLIISILITLYFFNFTDPKNLYYKKILTLVGPLALWLIGNNIKGYVKSFLIWISPASFPVFLGHILILNIYWSEWSNHFKSTPLTENYWLFWISSFVLCFSCMGLIAFLYKKVLILIKSFLARQTKNRV